MTRVMRNHDRRCAHLNPGHAQRIVSYDFVRVVAMVFVVGVHTHYVLDDLTGAAGIASSFLGTVVRTCNPLFFMVSGFFNIRQRSTKGELLGWYARKVRGLLLPVLIYFFLRTLYISWPLVDGPVVFIKTFAHNVFSGFISSEYWFIYSLLALLAVAPFLARMIDAMTDFECKALLGLCLGYNFVQMIMNNADVAFSWTLVFKDYAIYFLLGAILPRLVVTEKQIARLKLLGLAGILGTMVVAALGFSARAFDTSPLYTLVAVGMYYMLLDLGNRLGSCAAISFVAKHSLGVYLVHVVFLRLIASFLGAKFELTAGFVAFGAIVLLSVAASLVTAFVIDSLIVRPFQRIFDAILSTCKRLSDNH